MAWRSARGKGLQVSRRISQGSPLGSGSTCCFEDAVKPAHASTQLSSGTERNRQGFFLSRLFHSSPSCLARRRDEDSFGLRTPKREKYVKKESRIQPPVETPYVPPRIKREAKSLPDKTIDIFEGMTVVELAKRTGEKLSTLQDIIVNVGEKIESEFDPLSMDIAELVAMYRK